MPKYDLLNDDGATPTGEVELRMTLIGLLGWVLRLRCCPYQLLFLPQILEGRIPVRSLRVLGRLRQ